MNVTSVTLPPIKATSRLSRGIVLTLVVSCGLGGSPSYAQPKSANASKAPVVRQYTLADRVKYQLWDYVWKPKPDEAISRIVINISEQKVFVYQGSYLAGRSPITTGKPGHDTPPGHYSIISKDINHKSNLYGVHLDEHGVVISGDAKAGDPLPPGATYDSADMPYYLRIREDGVGLHAGYLPGSPASHGCIRLPHAFAELLYSNVSEGTPVDVVP